MKLTIYGKPDCKQCDMAKDILDAKGVKYEYKLIGTDITKEDLLNIIPAGIRQLPVIMDGSTYLGSLNWVASAPL